MTISRSEIKNAPYNPRLISDKARKKLRDKIAKVGLVNAPVWNRRTGNLVSGHQRLSVIDSLERKQDYLITVDAVDLDEKTEKEMNVFLNNVSAMGEWDFDAFKDLAVDFDVSELEGFGFDEPELQYMLGDGIFGPAATEKIKPEVEKLDAIKKTRKELKEKTGKLDSEGFYAVVVFQNDEELEAWISGCGYPCEERYVDGRFLAKLMGIPLDKGPACPEPETAA